VNSDTERPLRDPGRRPERCRRSSSFFPNLSKFLPFPASDIVYRRDGIRSTGVTLEISKADECDLPEILDLQKLAFQENVIRYNDHDIPPITQTLEEFVEESKEHLILKAVRGGSIVGSVRGSRTADGCLVSRLFVHPSHQNRGIGHRLMRAIEAEFDVPVFELVTGHLDDKNISLYKNLGYEMTDGEMEKITDNLYFLRMRKIVRRP
jgi:GNAT superfamily N-acetyltransferase